MTTQNKPTPNNKDNITNEAVDKELLELCRTADLAFKGIQGLLKRIKEIEKRISEIQKELQNLEAYWGGKPAWIEIKWVLNKYGRKYFYPYLRILERQPDGTVVKKSIYIGWRNLDEVEKLVRDNRRFRQLMKELQRLYSEYQRLQRRLEKIRRWLEEARIWG